ncbi:MAG: hypothetical protein J6O55_00750 [Lachnospiraceae bacterium]|nr:hypothetical protein [Lachnospiraceae bacterium]
MNTIFPVMAMLFIGIFFRKKQLVSREGVNAIKFVILNVCLPAGLISAFASTSYSPTDIIIPVVIFAVCFLAWIIGKYTGKLLRLPSRLVPFLTTAFEAGMLGYALFEMLYGKERLAEFARVDLGQSLFIFTIYKVLLSAGGGTDAEAGTADGRGNKGKAAPSAVKLLKEMFSSPIIIAIIIGVILGATNIYSLLKPSGVSGIFDACTVFISAPTSAMILFAIGYDLVLDDIPWAEALKVVLLRFAIMMILRTALIPLLNIISPAMDLTAAVNVMFILPPPFILSVLADEDGQRVYLSSVLSLSTVIAIIGFAVLSFGK